MTDRKRKEPTEEEQINKLLKMSDNDLAKIVKPTVEDEPEGEPESEQSPPDVSVDVQDVSEQYAGFEQEDSAEILKLILLELTDLSNMLRGVFEGLE